MIVAVFFMGLLTGLIIAGLAWLISILHGMTT